MIKQDIKFISYEERDFRETESLLEGKMKHGSLFSGIGGFDLAAEWMGWENVFHCENNSFCQKILKHYWPDAKSYGDIKSADFGEWKGKVDIISGGFPCQPYSAAGIRKGKEDDRHLWPEMLRAIREIQPRWVVGENVSGLLSWKGGMVLSEIKTDMEAAGFEVFPLLVLPACGKNAPHKRDRVWIVAHSNSGSAGKVGRNNEKMCGLQNEECRPKNGASLFGGKNQAAFTDTEKQRLSEWNAEQTRNGSHPTIERHNGFLQWQNFPTEPPLCGGDDGISNRVDRIKALGNAVVPQVVYEIFKSIEKSCL